MEDGKSAQLKTGNMMVGGVWMERVKGWRNREKRKRQTDKGRANIQINRQTHRMQRDRESLRERNRDREYRLFYTIMLIGL